MNVSSWISYLTFMRIRRLDIIKTQLKLWKMFSTTRLVTTLCPKERHQRLNTSQILKMLGIWTRISTESTESSRTTLRSCHLALKDQRRKLKISLNLLLFSQPKPLTTIVRSKKLLAQRKQKICQVLTQFLRSTQDLQTTLTKLHPRSKPEPQDTWTLAACQKPSNTRTQMFSQD